MLSSQRFELYGLVPRGEALDAEFALDPLPKAGLAYAEISFAADNDPKTVEREVRQILAKVRRDGVPAEHDNRKEPYGALWLENYCPVAREYGVWIAGVSNVGWLTDGPWQGRKCIGCSLVVGPTGEPVVVGPYGQDAETILYVDVQLAAPLFGK